MLRYFKFIWNYLELFGVIELFGSYIITQSYDELLNYRVIAFAFCSRVFDNGLGSVSIVCT